VNLLNELQVGGHARCLVKLELDHRYSHSTKGLVKQE
jgi:hypothetical protein